MTLVEGSSLELNRDVQIYIQKSLNKAKGAPSEDSEEELSRLLRVLAQPPRYTTLRVNRLKATCHGARSQVEEVLQSYDPPSPLRVLHHEVLPDTLVIPHIGPNKLDKLQKEVVVDHACGMAVLRGANVFAQGIMAAHPAMSVGDQVSVYADVNRLCRKGQTKEFDGKKLFVGNGVSCMSRQDLFCSEKAPSGLAVEMTQPLYYAPSLSGLLPEVVFPQNLPSILCGHILDPQPGETVLDMCAAPGGKTTHIGILMQNQGRVVALDRSKNKLQRLKGNVSVCGLTNVETYTFDGTKAIDETADLGGGPPYPPESFDRILVDAPCSALGQRPLCKNKIGLSAVTSYPALQNKLLVTAVQLLKSGGVLVFSTCTVVLEENENQVAKCLSWCPNMELCHQTPCLGGPGWHGSELSEEQRTMVRRFDPNAKCIEGTVDNDTIGFFIAKFIKR